MFDYQPGAAPDAISAGAGRRGAMTPIAAVRPVRQAAAALRRDPGHHLYESGQDSLARPWERCR